MKLRIFLARHPIFTRDEIAGHLAALGQGSPRTTDSLLAYHVRSGRLRRIRRGLYAVQGAGGESTVDPYLVAKLAPDSVLAYHTALELHGNAYSVHHQSLICTRHRVRPLSVDDHRYMALPPPKALRDRRQEDLGVENVDRSGLDVRVTRLERTLVDVLDRPDLGGGWEEIWRSLETIEFLDPDAVVEYALLLDSATTAAKVGFFLEEHRDSLMIEDAALEPLRRRRPRMPHYLERALRPPKRPVAGVRRPGTGERARLVAAWNLIVPGSLLQRTWEEVA